MDTQYAVLYNAIENFLADNTDLDWPDLRKAANELTKTILALL